MLKLTAACATHVGMIREMNEDSVWAQVFYPFNRPLVGLFIVCDGMGGHMGGEFASYWAVESIKREFADLFSSKDPRATVILRDAEDPAKAAQMAQTADKVEINLEERVLSAIQKANHVVYQYAHHKPDKAGNAGTTLSMTAILGDEAVIANAGDSRTYLLRQGELRQITQDHSLVANLVATGQIMPDEIYTHPQRNVIYRFLGQKGLVQPDLYYLTLQPGDFLLLCSDGFWEMVHSEKHTADLIRENDDPAIICQALIKAANVGGGEDNIGVVVVKITEAGH